MPPKAVGQASVASFHDGLDTLTPADANQFHRVAIRRPLG
jgi:hypothetical protein